MVQVGDVGTLGVDAGDVVGPTVLFGFQADSQRQVAATGLARHQYLRGAERLGVVDDPTGGRHTVVQPGREGIGSQHTGTVTELHADGDHPGGRQLIPPSVVAGVGGFQDHHAPTVGVHDGGHRSVGVLRTVNVEVDVVAVDTGDHFGGSGHSFHRWAGRGQDCAQLVESLLHLHACPENHIEG